MREEELPTEGGPQVLHERKGSVGANPTARELSAGGKEVRFSGFGGGGGEVGFLQNGKPSVKGTQASPGGMGEDLSKV